MSLKLMNVSLTKFRNWNSWINSRCCLDELLNTWNWITSY